MMSARRTAARTAVLGVTPLVLSLAGANLAAAHGSMTDPVSRVAACYAEGPENPRSAACKAAVKAGGTQALYDWNEVNIPDAAGRHKQIIPDGELCSAGRAKYKGLDLARKDWRSSKMTAGAHTFSYKATAPHKGSFALYITRPGYDASEPLKWSDLESKPFAKVKNPRLHGGAYKFKGKVPHRTGRHLVYSIWQRSDSPEAFYTCSDVTFGGKADGTAEQSRQRTPGAPSDSQIADGAGRSTVDHGGHGGAVKAGSGDAREDGGHEGHGDAVGHGRHSADGSEPGSTGRHHPQAAAPTAGELADTGDDGTATVAVGGGAVLLAGAALLFAGSRRRTADRRRS